MECCAAMWDLLQHFQINDAKEQARNATMKADSQATRVAALEDQVERLTLACQAMWELLRGHSGLTEDQLYAKVMEIDVRDGRLDGKVDHSGVTCPHCGQRTNTKDLHCTHCGKGVKPVHSFKP